MLRNIAFILCMILYIGFPLQMIFSYENILDEGKVFRFQPQPVDPYHPFKGRYVSLNYGRLQLDYPNAEEKLEELTFAYVSLKVDSLGYAYADAIYPEIPEDKDYLQVELGYINNDKVNFDYPFDEYFMNEQMAPRAEQEVGRLSRNQEREDVYIDVRIKGGVGVIEQLYVKGKPIEEFLRETEERTTLEE